MMKYTTAFIAVLFFVAGYGQKQFEGTIVYQIHIPDDKVVAPELVVLFGKNALRLKFKEKGDYDKEEIVIRLDSGKIYTLNTEEKTFRVKKLVEKEKNDSTLAGKKIAGFNTKAVDLSGSGAGGSFGSYFGTANTVFYIADSLFYFLPEKYTPNQELIFLYQNQIALGANITLSDKYEEADADSTGKKRNISAEAISVKWETIDENEFSVPADFVKYTYESRVDTAIEMVDTAIAAPPVKPVKKPSVNNTKQPAKPKTKAGSTKTGAIRKPE
jgi:hypothetical protein